MQDLTVNEFKEIRVLTTQQLAEEYETMPDVITKNFNRNKERYSEGKHYIVLEGNEKHEFINRGQFDRGLKNAKTLYLWTKKGAFLHAKSLNTDQAWEVYDHLVDTYFDKKYDANSSSQVSFKEVAEAIPSIAADLHVNGISHLIMYKGLCKDYGVPTGFLPDYVQGGDRDKKTVTDLLNDIGSTIKAIGFNRKLLTAGYLEERTRKSSSSKTGIKRFKALTEKGLDFGENQINPNNPKETQPYYYVDTFSKLYDQINNY